MIEPKQIQRAAEAFVIEVAYGMRDVVARLPTVDGRHPVTVVDRADVDLPGGEHRHDRGVVGHDADLAGQGAGVHHGRLARPDLTVGRHEGHLHRLRHRSTVP